MTYTSLNNNKTTFWENYFFKTKQKSVLKNAEPSLSCQKKLKSTNNELNPAKIENQTKKYVPFIIHELGLHIGDKGSTEST